MAIMKFAWRSNLLYPIHLLLWTFVRKINSMLLDILFDFSANLLFTLIMFFAEFFTGLLCYYIQNPRSNQEYNKTTKDIYIYLPSEISRRDSLIKIYFLTFVAAFFDFIEYILWTNIIPKFKHSSNSFDARLGAMMIISSALFYRYVLNFPILGHQFFSLAIMGICLIIIVILEFVFQDVNLSFTYEKFFIKLLLIVWGKLTHSFMYSIDKYVFEYDFFNHFQSLFIQGFFGFVISLIYHFISDDTFISQFSRVYSDSSAGKFTLFIFLLFIYFILCGVKNAFRMVTNKIYNPMTCSLTEIFLNPIDLIINYYYYKEDFKIHGNQNFFFFLINLIISLIIDLFGLVFNEILILFFCHFERDTHDQISLRSLSNYVIDLEEFYAPIEDGCEDELELSLSLSMKSENQNRSNSIIIK